MLKFKHHFDLELTSGSDIAMERAFNALFSEMDSEDVGYYKLPKDSLVHLESLKSLDTKNIEQIVVMGIGGSLLGIKAIDSILRPHAKDAKELILFENSDPITISANLAKIQKDKALFFIISKSGSTIETTSAFKTIMATCGLKLDGADAKRIFAITDFDSVLSKFAQHHKIQEFNIPDNVGGRFSVLSAVGVVPLALVGYDMSALLAGAGSFIQRFFAHKEDHLLQKALYMYEHRLEQSINILFSYADSLENMTKWYVQLWGESLGKLNSKGDHLGLTPIGIIGAVDQHSFLQLLIEGPRDKSVTFINIEDFGNNLCIPDISLHAIEKTDFINNQSFATLINAQCAATMQSVVQSGIPADSISFDRVTPQNVGEMIVYYELLTSLIGSFLQVNTYNQPGVELGKQILYKNLSK